MDRRKLMTLYAEWYSHVFERGIWPRVEGLCPDPGFLADCREWAKFAFRHVLFMKMDATGRLAERHTRYALSFLFFVPVMTAFAVVLTGSSFALSAVAVVCAVVSATAANSLANASFGSGRPYVEVGTKVIDPHDGTLDWFLKRESGTITLAGALRLARFGEELTQGRRRGAGRAFVSFEHAVYGLKM